MVDEREKQLAKTLVNYSCQVKRGEKVLIEYSDCSNSFLQCLVDEVIYVGAYPFLVNLNRQVLKNVLEKGNEELFTLMGKYDAYRMQEMDAVILIRGDSNIFEFSQVPQDNIMQYNNFYVKPVHMVHRLKKKWVNLRFPTPSFAQSAQLSTTAFEDHFFKVCNLDYSKMCTAMDALKELMERTDKVKIVAKNTCLEFSIKNISAVKCCGEKNIPDGEIYTAPVKNSINGTIEFNVPAMYNGIMHNKIMLEFENGKITNAKSNNTKALLDIINTDEGSSYIGEFSFGVNPFITRAINDILFDEKMCYSIHMAIGNSYDDAYNGNNSSVHWDIIQSHTKENGGGEIYFDSVLIRKDGVFIVPNLLALNPENLV